MVYIPPPPPIPHQTPNPHHSGGGISNTPSHYLRQTRAHHGHILSGKMDNSLGVPGRRLLQIKQCFQIRPQLHDLTR